MTGSTHPPRAEIAAVHRPGAPAWVGGFRSRERGPRGFGEVVADDAEIVFAPEVGRGGGVGCVLRGEECGAGEDEAAHRRERAAERDEHALEAGEHAFATYAVFADDDGGGFTEPERGAFVGRGVFEKFLEHAAPRIPMRAGADEETVGALERVDELRGES